jgi:hypothetical protein
MVETERLNGKKHEFVTSLSRVLKAGLSVREKMATEEGDSMSAEEAACQLLTCA